MRALWSHYFWDVWFPPDLIYFFSSLGRKLWLIYAILLKKILSLEFETWDLELEIWNLEFWKLKFWDLKLEILNMRFWKLKLGTWNFAPWDFETSNLELEIWNLETGDFEIWDWIWKLEFYTWEWKFWIKNLGFENFWSLNLNPLSLIHSKNFLSLSFFFFWKSVWPFSFHDLIFDFLEEE